MKHIYGLLFLAFFANGMPCYAQAEPDDIVVENDKFQEFFYESLKQKGIQNYDKAIIALEKCLELAPGNAVVYHELGKNYLLQKDYKQAYEAFEMAHKADPSNKWYLVGMYEVCYQTHDYNQSIVLVSKLIPFDQAYKEDLTSLYMNTQQFDKALDLINELNDKVGRSEKRDFYKSQILTDVKYQGVEKANLLDQIKKNPKDESNYIALIYLYSNSNQEEKAMEIAMRLQEELPESDWAQVSLFKFHLNNNEGSKAVVSMNKVLKSNIIDNKIKHRIINEFLVFTNNNPQFDKEFEQAVAYFNDDKNIRTAKELGKFYHSKKEWDKAIRYYEIDRRANSEDMETALLLFQVYAETSQFTVLSAQALDMIELFPLQPELYYYAGLAYNQLKNHKAAVAVLENGLDFIIDNTDLEINFNIQLGEAFNGVGDNAKKEVHFLKAEKLLNKKK